MGKTYDNYDYEEAYQKQIENLEEWELERMMKDGKVACLYRTTTIKSRNEKSGAVMVESMVYPSFKNKADIPKTAKKRESKPSQKNLNDKNARRYLIRLVNINFGKGDIWGTFGWDDTYMPKDAEAARRDIKNFIARINYRRRKFGKENIRYIYILAFGSKVVRPHFHIIMTGEGVDRDELEELWIKCERKNTRRIQPDDDFLVTGIAIYISQNPHGAKRWCPSKNLKKPDAPTRSYRKFSRPKVNVMVRDYEKLKEQMEKAYPGYTFLDAEVTHNGKVAAFYIYARMIKKRDKGKEKTKNENCINHKFKGRCREDNHGGNYGGNTCGMVRKKGSVI